MCATFALLLAVHGVALEYALYWRYAWFDTVSHLLGGLTAGLAIAWYMERSGRTPNLLAPTLGALVIGICWEFVDTTDALREANYVLDTSSDLLMDSLGGLSAALIALLRRTSA